MQPRASDSSSQFHKVEKAEATAGVGVQIRRGETVIEIDNQASDPLLTLLKEVEYSCAAEPPVRCGESHHSGLTEPPKICLLT